MSSFTTSSSSADEFSPLQPIFPNLSPSEEMSVLIARIAELNRAKTMEPSVASSEAFGQDGYGMNDDGFSLDEEEDEDEQQEDRKTPTKDVLEDHFKAILERIGEIEKQQQQQTKAFLQSQNDQKKILEKGNATGRISVFAKYPIVLNKHLSDFFYYEISVMKKDNCVIIFGFAVKQQTKLDGLIHYEKGTYAYENDGYIWINGQAKGKNAEYSYGVGDTVGIGVNFATRQMIFTKNGVRLRGK
ncbi:hypothetical protein niasHS_015562 [Heterodera schachtii]|uniref:B30.2/SPRY domain-containing protein n=1 Tax=Heterodera schachtii TaxID=97005 RepID=A0ABD2HXF5_HETSC